MTRKSRPKADPYEGYMHADHPRMLAVLKGLADHGAVIAFSQDGDDSWLWHPTKSFCKLPPDIGFGRVAGEGYVADDPDDDLVRSPGSYSLTPKGLDLVARSGALASTEEDIVRATTPKGEANAEARTGAERAPADAFDVLSRALDDRLRQDAILRQNDPVAVIAEAMAMVCGFDEARLMAAARLSYRTASLCKASEKRASYERDLRMAAALAQGLAQDARSDVAAMTAALRGAGWAVAVHNDYRLGGKAHTFWLWTNAEDRCVKGEGTSDSQALRQCLAKAGLD